MVFNHGLGETVLSGTVPGASFFIMMVVIIKSSPETINKIYFMLNERVNNSSANRLMTKNISCKSRLKYPVLQEMSF